jgi:hypothetical protein
VGDEQGGPIRIPLGIHGQVISGSWPCGGSARGKTLVIPDELDVPDADDDLQGVGVDGLATGSSSASGWVVVSGGGCQGLTAWIFRKIANWLYAQAYSHCR